MEHYVGIGSLIFLVYIPNVPRLPIGLKVQETIKQQMSNSS